MRFLLVLGIAAILSGCATAPSEHSYVSPGVTAPANSAISVRAYNREIARQGMAHYCGSGNCDQLPVLLQAFAPIYPAAELQAKINGNAIIVFDITKDGTLANFKIETATSESFALASVQALKLWRFDPPRLKGKPIEFSSRVSFPFVAR